MKAKEIVLYDSYYSEEKEEHARDFLFELYAEEEKWTSPQDIPDYRVFQEIESEDDICWEDIKLQLKILFKSDYFLLTGLCGTWHGQIEGGKFISTLSELLGVLEHLNDLRIIDSNGHLIIEGSHHDGNDKYELKKLTHKGYELASNYHFAKDRQLHNIIMKSNLFSSLPKLAKQIGYC